jgi:hypothetical protein
VDLSVLHQVLRAHLAAMAVRAVTSALVVASVSGELHCIGRVAHELLSAPEVGDFSLSPIPDRNSECLIQEATGSTKSFCLGWNQDEACSGANKPSYDLGLNTHCSNCFVAAHTDLLYNLHTERWIPQNMSFGFQNTRILSNVQISQDQHAVIKSKSGSKVVLSNPIELHLPFPFSRNISLEMPIEISYSGFGAAGLDGAVGAEFKFEIDNTVIQWVKGEGWSRNFNRPSVFYKPQYLPTDIAADTNITVGFQSTFKATFGEHTWYHRKLSASVPIKNSAELLPKEIGVQECLDFGIDFEMMQEAEASFKLPLIQKDISTKHFGPSQLGIHRPDMVHRCFKKARKPPSLEVASPALVV